MRPIPDAGARLARLDAVGASLSTLCAVHCLVIPFALAFLPALGLTFLADEEWESAVCLGLVLLASVCLGRGCRRHRQLRVLLWLAVGFPFLIIAQFGLHDESSHAPHPNYLEAGLMFTGGLCLAAGHLHNRRLARRCQAGCCAEESMAHETRERHENKERNETRHLPATQGDSSSKTPNT